MHAANVRAVTNQTPSLLHIKFYTLKARKPGLITCIPTHRHKHNRHTKQGGGQFLPTSASRNNERTALSLFFFLGSVSQPKRVASRLQQRLITHSFLRSLPDIHTHTHTHVHVHTYKTFNTQVKRCSREFFFPPSHPSYTRLFLWQQAPVSGTEKWKLAGSMSGLQAAGSGMVGGLGRWS